MPTYLEVAYLAARSWCHPLLNAVQNKPALAAKHAAWGSHPLSDLAFAVGGRLIGLRETVRAIDRNLSILGRELERDPSAVNYGGSEYAYQRVSVTTWHTLAPLGWRSKLSQPPHRSTSRYSC